MQNTGAERPPDDNLAHDFDSAWAPTGPFGGSLEENCVKDPKRIKILQAIPGVTTKLDHAGYTIAGDRIVKRGGGGFDQPPAGGGFGGGGFGQPQQFGSQDFGGGGFSQPPAGGGFCGSGQPQPQPQPQYQPQPQAPSRQLQPQYTAPQQALAQPGQQPALNLPTFKSSSSLFSMTFKFCLNCGQGTANGARTTCKQCNAAHWVKADSPAQAAAPATLQRSRIKAVENGDTTMVVALLKVGTLVNCRDPDCRKLYGRAPLHIAASRNYDGVAKVLMAHGADVNARTDWWGGSSEHPQVGPREK
jgi:hypothetical protein